MWQPSYVPRGEIEYGMGGRANPFAKVTSIGKGHAARNNPRLYLRLSRNVASAREDHFVRGSGLPAHLLNLVGDEKPKRLDVFPLPPSSRDDIPLYDYCLAGHFIQSGLHEPVLEYRQ